MFFNEEVKMIINTRSDNPLKTGDLEKLRISWKKGSDIQLSIKFICKWIL